MVASRTGNGVVRCWRDVRALFHIRVPNPAPLDYDHDQFSTQNWIIKKNNVLTQQFQPSIWVKKNNPEFFRVYTDLCSANIFSVFP